MIETLKLIIKTQCFINAQLFIGIFHYLVETLMLIVVFYLTMEVLNFIVKICYLMETIKVIIILTYIMETQVHSNATVIQYWHKH